MSISYSGPSGLNVTMFGMALLLGIWLLQMLVLQRRFELVDWPTVRAGLVLCLVGVLALLMGLLPWFPTKQARIGAQLGGLALVVLSIGTFAWTSNVIKSLFWLKVLTYRLYCLCLAAPTRLFCALAWHVDEPAVCRRLNGQHVLDVACRPCVCASTP